MGFEFEICFDIIDVDFGSLGILWGRGGAGAGVVSYVLLLCVLSSSSSEESPP